MASTVERANQNAQSLLGRLGDGKLCAQEVWALQPLLTSGGVGFSQIWGFWSFETGLQLARVSLICFGIRMAD